MTWPKRLFGAIAVAALLAGCSSSGTASSPGTAASTGTPSPTAAPPSSATPSQPRAGSQTIVALGDSVPRGTNCDCRPYPPLTADDLVASTGRTVSAVNDSVAGATSEDVLTQLTYDGAVIDHVRRARSEEHTSELQSRRDLVCRLL